jgi:PAS domain S-box-containing protein
MDYSSRNEAEPQAVEQLLGGIIEFLPDATFVIDQNNRNLAWNRACEIMTGVKKEGLLGQGDYAYAVPFFGERRPILIDLLDGPSPEIEAQYKYVRRVGRDAGNNLGPLRLRRSRHRKIDPVSALLFS